MNDGTAGGARAGPEGVRTTEHVVVAVQGDDASVAALRWGARHARARHAEVEALMAWELPEPPRHMTGDLEDLAEGVLGDLQWALDAIVERSAIRAEGGLAIQTTVVAAPAKVAMADAVERADLLVLGSVHHAAAVAALSVARRTAASASCPVVLVPVPVSAAQDGAATGDGRIDGRVDGDGHTASPDGQPWTADGEGDRIVVGVDGSAQSRQALQWACDEGSRRGLPVSAFTVSPSLSELDAVTGAVAEELVRVPGLDLRLVRAHGDAGDVLLAESVGAEALVIGQHGSGRLRRRLPSLGSVSRWCAAHPVSPVVVVPKARVRDRRLVRV